MIEYTPFHDWVILRLNVPPVNALSFALLDELLAGVRRAVGDPQVRSIVITGGPEYFSAGVDLALFREIGTAEQAVHVSQVFQAAFQEIEDSPKPVIAALAGHVVGGGLELAMACHFRVAAASTRFSMPEVRLGINPGAGGTQRLPRLVGLDAALDMLIGGQSIDAEQAISLGLVDALSRPDELAAVIAGGVFCPSESEELAPPRAAADRLPGGGEDRGFGLVRRTSQREEKIRDAAANRKAFARAEELVAAVRPELIAPGRIVQAIRIGIDESFEAGLRSERLAFSECIATRAAQNKVYVFCAGRQAGKDPEATGPRHATSSTDVRIARAGVLGMGTMGAGIAQTLLAAGISVTACDENQDALDRALRRIRVSLDGRVGQGRLTAAQADQMIRRLRVTTDCQALADAQAVIEAVIESAPVKRVCLARLEELCSADTLIATNTSTLNLDLLAADMRCPERLVGMHFFHPAQHMPLVEIVRRETTPAPVTAAAVRLARFLGKTPVLVRNREGFLVNRLFVPYLKEAFRLLEEGAESAVVDQSMVEFGFAMGPLVLIDMSGLDILVMTDAVLREAYPWHGPLSVIVSRLVERGCLGQKTGAGVYRYEAGDRTPLASTVSREIIEKARGEAGEAAGASRGASRGAGIVERLMLRMVAEAFRVVEEGVVDRPADVDVAMVLGTGLADFRGGVLKYACDVGADRVLDQLQRLAGVCGERYAPCDLLRAAAADHHAMGRLLGLTQRAGSLV